MKKQVFVFAFLFLNFTVQAQQIKRFICSTLLEPSIEIGIFSSTPFVLYTLGYYKISKSWWVGEEMGASLEDLKIHIRSAFFLLLPRISQITHIYSE